jgi:hypothetical protein
MSVRITDEVKMIRIIHIKDQRYGCLYIQ